MRKVWLVCAAALLAAVPQEKLDKARHPWARWKPGSFTKFSLVTQAGDKKQESSMTMTLESVTEDGYSLKNSFEAMGKTKDQTETESFPTKAGEESLTIDGKSYACTIWQSSGKKGDTKTDTRYWVANEVDAALKVVTKAADKEETVFTAVKLSEEITVAGQKLDCVRLEGKMSRRGNQSQVTVWMSPKVPGGTVKMSIDLKTSAGAATMTMEAVQFEAK